MNCASSDVEQDGDGRRVAVDLHHVVCHSLHLRPDPVAGPVQGLAPGVADHVVALEAHVELLQDQVVAVLYEEELGQERVQAVLVVDAADPDVRLLGRPDAGEVHRLVEEGVAGVGEAFLQGLSECPDHHVCRVVHEDVAFHGPSYGVPEYECDRG